MEPFFVKLKALMLATVLKRSLDNLNYNKRSLICSANQLIAFYMMATLAFNELNTSESVNSTQK